MKHYWTPSEEERLKELYPNNTTEYVSEQLNIPIWSIYNKAHSLGLKKNEAYLNSPNSGRMQKGDKRGLKSRFPKGHIPVNKGQKMPEHVYEKVSRTMFKKGHIPATTKYFGKPYLFERVRKNGTKERSWLVQIDRKRRSYMAYLCQQNGIDLTGKKARLKSSYDYSNPPTLNDIEIISNAENLQLNSMQRFPADLIRLIQVKGALQRQLNKLNNE